MNNRAKIQALLPAWFLRGIFFPSEAWLIEGNLHLKFINLDYDIDSRDCYIFGCITNANHLAEIPDKGCLSGLYFYIFLLHFIIKHTQVIESGIKLSLLQNQKL